MGDKGSLHAELMLLASLLLFGAAIILKEFIGTSSIVFTGGLVVAAISYFMWMWQKRMMKRYPEAAAELGLSNKGDRIWGEYMGFNVFFHCPMYKGGATTMGSESEHMFDVVVSLSGKEIDLTHKLMEGLLGVDGLSAEYSVAGEAPVLAVLKRKKGKLEELFSSNSFGRLIYRNSGNETFDADFKMFLRGEAPTPSERFIKYFNENKNFFKSKQVFIYKDYLRIMPPDSGILETKEQVIELIQKAVDLAKSA